MASDSDLDSVLSPRLKQLRALRSAWGVLAPSGFSEHGLEISEAGRALTARLRQIQQTGGEVTPSVLQEIDARLDEFETSMRNVARNVSVRQLRSTLPAQQTSDRVGLLDLLDVLIGNDPSDFEAVAGHIGAIDYLITLLCTSGESSGGRVQHDPVTLTTRIHAFCEHANAIDGSQYADVEAEFFTASNMDGEDLREEFQLRTLRTRKAELGMAFFIPRILRAVTTYNAAILDRVADEILDSDDWGSICEEGASDADHAQAPGSVFLSEPLKRIAESACRRANGEEAQPTASDRIAWALDFDYLQAAERKALLSGTIGTDQDPLGTAILVGLMCRSVAVLSIELQTIGIPLDDVLDNWVAELSNLFQDEIDTYISDDAYKVACALSELKNKFLSAPLADQFRQQESPGQPRSLMASPAKRRSKPTKEQQNARDLVQHALDETRKSPSTESGGIIWREFPWTRLALGTTLTLAIAVAGVMFLQSDSGLERWSHDQLSKVSPYLARGKRDGDGAGRAFVGTIDESWLTLPLNERGEAADQLVSRLRDLGMNQIMIYDDDDELRIQALGSQPIRTL